MCVECKGRGVQPAAVYNLELREFFRDPAAAAGLAPAAMRSLGALPAPRPRPAPAH